MAVLLTCKDVRLEYPSKELFRDVTLGVNTGDRIGIVGKNGDGKSTLLKVLSRHIEPDGGQVIPSGSATVGVLGQTDSFADDDTVEDILAGARTAAYVWQADHLKHRWRPNEGALLVVTHDRWFLDTVCEHMWEVHDGQVDPFEGGFSAYIMQRVERDRLAALAKQKHENQLRRELAWLSRGAQARRSKPKFHVEAAQELIADVPTLRDPIELKQMATARLGKQCLELYDVCVDRGGRRILSDVTWNIGPGDRIGILGENGTGKTTLLSVLNGTLKPTLGHIKIGKTVKFATLSQNLTELADIEDDVIRVVLGRYKTYYVVEGRKLSPVALCERLGFTRDEINARVKDLSGGQRRRLQLLLILFDEPNVLIMDEPTNDLDTDMLAVTEDLLDTWPGTLIVVSHDRYFIERVTDNQYAILDTHIEHMPGGVDEYLEKLAALQKAKAGRAQTQAAQDALSELEDAWLEASEKLEG